MDHGAVFAEHRPAMLAAAFHVTGSREEAEDVVQDAWEAWSRVDLATVQAPRAFLSVMVSRRALNAVRAQRRRRRPISGRGFPIPSPTTAPRSGASCTATGSARRSTSS